MSKHYDTLETRSPAEREKALMQALPQQIAHAKENAPFFAEWLKDVDPASVTSRAALARLPVLRKAMLGEVQKKQPADGRADHRADEQGAPCLHVARSDLRGRHRRARLFPRRARHACRRLPARRRRLQHLLLSPDAGRHHDRNRRCGRWAAPSCRAASATPSCSSTPSRRSSPTGYVGTPSFLKILIEKAAELARTSPRSRSAFVGAEALPPSLRQMFIDKGMTCLQSYGTADLGTIAYESEALEGMIVDEGVIVEIVRPGTGDPVPEGDVGEVVVTTFNRAYPLIRFGTGDMSAVLAGPSPCGRTNMRIKGWMGRADQRTKVRGMFVDPEQIAEISKKHPGLGRLRLVIDWVNQADVMTLKVEAAQPSPISRRRWKAPSAPCARWAARSSSPSPAACPTTAR